MQKLIKHLSQNKIDLFYLLALAPIGLILYYNVFSAIIPLYGFSLLLIKKEKLNSFLGSNRIQKLLGLTMIIGSFFVYYALAPLLSITNFYGVPNYVTYLLGLFLVFFNLSAIKEAFSPLFLITAATSSSIISNTVKPYLAPHLIPLTQNILETILRALGVKFSTHSNIIVLQTWKGPLPLSFVWGCVGFYSTLVFSIILIVLLSEDQSKPKTKITWAIIGLSGTLTVNILRLTTIFLTDYYYGTEVGGKVHYFIGYTLFTTWLITFLYIYTKLKKD
jgi:exosortase/archaeosortase family protein